jgi:hypothetical protein
MPGTFGCPLHDAKERQSIARPPLEERTSISQSKLPNTGLTSGGAARAQKRQPTQKKVPTTELLAPPCIGVMVRIFISFFSPVLKSARQTWCNLRRAVFDHCPTSASVRSIKPNILCALRRDPLRSEPLSYTKMTSTLDIMQAIESEWARRSRRGRRKIPGLRPEQYMQAGCESITHAEVLLYTMSCGYGVDEGTKMEVMSRSFFPQRGQALKKPRLEEKR